MLRGVFEAIIKHIFPNDTRIRTSDLQSLVLRYLTAAVAAAFLPKVSCLFFLILQIKENSVSPNLHTNITQFTITAVS